MENKTIDRLISFLDIQENERLLELTDGQQVLAPVLKRKLSTLDYSLDLFIFSNEKLSESVDGYQNSFYVPQEESQVEEIQQPYDLVIIPSLFSTLTKEKGYKLLNKLFVKGATTIYLVIEEKAVDSWTIQDFKDYDFSFFNLDDIGTRLIKLYPPIVKEIQVLPPLHQASHPLSILYVIPHLKLTGGIKMLYGQMKELQKRGHFIIAMIRGDYERAVPEWIKDFTPNQEIIVPSNELYLSYINHVDIIFAGLYSQLKELQNKDIPVLYWEQGHEYLYGDVLSKENEKIVRSLMIEQFSQEVYYATDSVYVHDIVKTRFHKDSYILPIFIDTDFYYPMRKELQERRTILLVGNPILEFKGFQKALQVLVTSWNRGFRFNVKWACQTKATTSPLPFEIEYIVNASQEELARTYRESDILLSCSVYEGCPMPPLEAMASGVAVITTNCGGINQYATHKKNALIASSNTVVELVTYLEHLLTHEVDRQILIKNGLKTADEFSCKNSGIWLEEILQSVVDDFSKKTLLPTTSTKRVKILFMIGTLLGGGAEKVLLNIVKRLDKTLFDITVQTIQDQGIYIEEIKKYSRYKTIYQTTAKNHEETKKLSHYYQYLKTLSNEEFSRVVIDDDYDIEVAFLEDYSTKFIAYSPNKKAKKVAWVHTDLLVNTAADNIFDSFEEHNSCYQAFHQIVCVSEGARNAFIKKFNIKDNILVLYNPINEVEIREKASLASENLDENIFKIVSVGRLVKEKGYDRLLIIFKKLKEIGFRCKLILIGEGSERSRLEQYIKDNDLVEDVSLMGFLDNPYALLSTCDLFVCSSNVEGLSSAVLEALILGIPIVATDCGGNQEILKNGEAGVLVNNDIQSLCNGIFSVLTNVPYYYELKEKSKQRGNDFSYEKQLLEIQTFLLDLIHPVSRDFISEEDSKID